jgi:hypothetical protein
VFISENYRYKSAGSDSDRKHRKRAAKNQSEVKNLESTGKSSSHKGYHSILDGVSEEVWIPEEVIRTMEHNIMNIEVMEPACVELWKLEGGDKSESISRASSVMGDPGRDELVIRIMESTVSTELVMEAVVDNCSKARMAQEDTNKGFAIPDGEHLERLEGWSQKGDEIYDLVSQGDVTIKALQKCSKAS